MTHAADRAVHAAVAMPEAISAPLITVGVSKELRDRLVYETFRLGNDWGVGLAQVPTTCCVS